MKLYVKLAGLVAAMKACEKVTGVDEAKARAKDWASTHRITIMDLVAKYMPRGSGFDCGTKLDLDKSTGERLVFTTDFHHMNDVGMYDGWTAHTITVRPSLSYEIGLAVSGKNRNDIKNCIHELFDTDLRQEVQ